MDFLETVARERLADAAAAREALAPHVLERAARSAPPSRPFVGALRARRAEGRLAVVAEVKRVSPALGELAAIGDPAALARAYVAAGATAISVLTEPRHWGGSLDDLAAVREAVDVPILCKDVIVDPFQVSQARAHGADAVLLIAEAFDELRLALFVAQARQLGLDVLVEAHEPAAFVRAVGCGAVVVGVNARDLREPGRIEPRRVHELAPLARPDQILVAESGIASAADAELLPERVDAVLVGTALVRAADPAPLLRSLAAVRRRAGVVP